MNNGIHQISGSPSGSIPRIGSFGSINNGSETSLTSYSSGNSNPSNKIFGNQHGIYEQFPNSHDCTRAMNATQSYASHPHHSYMDNHHAHQMSSSAMPTSMPSYSHYQGPPMQPPMASYAQPHPYHYQYPQVVTSQPHPSQHYTQHTLPAPPPSQPPSLAPHNRSIDQTGQVQPPNHKPKLTGTVWEDEGTICFQVEVNGICVARREDNHYINGTKLLNVANMTRGRRDGILKSEKLRSVIKIGPMHLKGVWIPFDRALEFANKEKITEQLYPLFVENISPLLTPHMQETLRGARYQNGQQQLLRNSSVSQSTHSSTSHPQPAAASTQPATPSNSLVSTSRTTERSNTFPTPPTSTSSIIGTNQTGGYNDWSTLTPSTQAPLAVDSSAHGKSLPATPTAAPSEHPMHQQYTAQYDPSRPVYSAPPPQHHYGGTAYGQMYPIKTEMAAPARPAEKEEDGNHYGHDQGYTYNSNDTITGDSKSSPHTQGSGRATPRSIATPQSQWQSTTYSTPQGRSHQPLPSSSLTFGSSVTSNGYTAPTPSTSYTYPSGPSNTLKRGRDDEDDDPYARPVSGPDPIKRQRTMPLPSEASRSALAQQQL